MLAMLESVTDAEQIGNVALASGLLHVHHRVAGWKIEGWGKR